MDAHVDPNFVTAPAPGRACRRRGSVYLLVLGLGTILAIIGLGSLAVVRAGTRTMSDSADWSEAKVLAFSGIDHAMVQINRNSGWRTTYNNVTVTQSLGRGTFSWHITDDTDNNLTDDPSEPYTIWATGTIGSTSYTMKAHMVAGTTGGGLSAGTVTSGTITLAGSAYIDSYDSTLGAYGGANVGSNAAVLTNSTSNNAVSLAWSTAIKGSVQVGPNGNPANVISQASGANVTGATGAMSAAVTMPTLTAPTMGASTGDMTVGSNSITTISSNQHVNKLTISNSGLLKISGQVTLLLESNLSISGSGGIEVLANSSLTIYVKGSTTIGASTSIDGPNLSNIKLFNLGTNAVTISGSGQFRGVIMSPTGNVTIQSGGIAYGAIVAKQISLSGSAAFHEDRRITTHVDNVTIPGTSGGTATVPHADSWNRVVN